MEQPLTNNDSSAHYRIFILTVWYEGETDAEESSTWRIRLEDSKTKVSVGCIGVSGLVDLLIQQIIVKSTQAESNVDEPKT